MLDICWGCPMAPLIPCCSAQCEVFALAPATPLHSADTLSRRSSRVRCGGSCCWAEQVNAPARFFPDVKHVAPPQPALPHQHVH